MLTSLVIWFLLFWGFRVGRIRLIYLIIYTVLCIPIFFFSVAFSLIKVYLDRRRISGAITKAISTNYVIANFIKENKRKEPIVCTLNKDGMSFDYNDGLYLINQEMIIWNDKNQPEGYWVYDDPEQKDIYGLFAGSDSPDKRLYSPQNLKKFQKDKFFSELHRDPSAIGPELQMGVMVIGFIIIIVIMIYMRKGG